MSKASLPRPLSITIIAILFVIGSILSCLSLQRPALVLGFIWTGLPALLHNLLSVLLGLCVGIGLWRLRELARRCAIGLSCYGIFNAVVSIFNPFGELSLWRLKSKLDVALSELPSGSVFSALHGAVTGLAVVIIPLCVILWFLVTRKAAFGKPGTMPAQGEITAQPQKAGRIVIRLAAVGLLLWSYSSFVSLASVTGVLTDPSAIDFLRPFNKVRTYYTLAFDGSLILAAIGLLLLHSWARIMLITLLGFGISFHSLEAVLAVVGVEGAYLDPIGLLIPLGVQVGLIVVLTRPAVKAQFRQGGRPPAIRKEQIADDFTKRNLMAVGSVLGLVAIGLGVWAYSHRGGGRDSSRVFYGPDEPPGPMTSVPPSELPGGYPFKPVRVQQAGVGQTETDRIVAAVQSVTPETIQLEEIVVIPESVTVYGEVRGTDENERQRQVSTYVSTLTDLPDLTEVVIALLRTKKEEDVTVLEFIVEGRRATQPIAEVGRASELKEAEEDRAEVAPADAAQVEAAVRSAAPASIHLKQISVSGETMTIEGEIPSSGGSEMLMISAYVRAIKELPGLSEVQIESIRRSMREGVEIVDFGLAARLGAQPRVPAPKAPGAAGGPEARIAGLEARLREHPGTFDQNLHNELRHLYAGIDERKSAEHTNVILEHRPLDPYMLNILSGWQLDKNRDEAISNLLHWADTYPDLKFIQAACWIKVGDVYAETGDTKNAQAHYQKVISDRDPRLSEYRSLALSRLRGLRSTD